jgi:homoserine kinase
MIKIRVPATSANLGPGFDCMGLALNLYNHFYIEEVPSGLSITGCPKPYQGEDNLVYTSLLHTLKSAGYTRPPKGLNIHIESDIPVCRGLGSSASCIAAGVIGANALYDLKLTTEDIIRICASIEGHPDNTTPALLGGFTIAIEDNDDIVYQRIVPPAALRLCAIIPDFTLSTSKARAVLPDMIPRCHGVFNTGRAALLTACLYSGDLQLLKTACQDRLHQGYRAELIPGYDEVISKGMELGCLAEFLSGAGPTIMAILNEDDTLFLGKMQEFLKESKRNWTIKLLSLDYKGVVIQQI